MNVIKPIPLLILISRSVKLILSLIIYTVACVTGWTEEESKPYSKNY